jgi:hypothetical protein
MRLAMGRGPLRALDEAGWTRPGGRTLVSSHAAKGRGWLSDKLSRR